MVLTDRKVPRQASFEGLPAELRREILENIPDAATLRSLVHASPVYHAIYRLDPCRPWNALTRRHLAMNNIGLLNEPIPCVQVSLRSGCPVSSAMKRELKHALSYSYEMMQQGLEFSLLISQCKALLQITDAVGWKILPLSEETRLELDSGDTGHVACGRPIFQYTGWTTIKSNQHGGAVFAMDEAHRDAVYPQGFKNYITLTLEGFGTRLLVEPRLDKDAWYPTGLEGLYFEWNPPQYDWAFRGDFQHFTPIGGGFHSFQYRLH